jgi:hypothetical protein
MGLLQQYVGKVDLKQIAQEFYPSLPTDDGTVHWLHFVNTAWMAVVLLIVRIVADHTLLPVVTTRMAKHGKGNCASMLVKSYETSEQWYRSAGCSACNCMSIT